MKTKYEVKIKLIDSNNIFFKAEIETSYPIELLYKIFKAQLSVALTFVQGNDTLKNIPEAFKNLFEKLDGEHKLLLGFYDKAPDEVEKHIKEIGVEILIRYEQSILDEQKKIQQAKTVEDLLS